MPRPHSSIVGPRPAHDTKGEGTLQYPFFDKTFILKQQDDGQSNGTGLWLGSQCLSVYLASVQPILLRKCRRARLTRKPRAIELGSGLGLGALALASFGWDVVATDTSFILDTVLAPNVSANASTCLPGVVEAKELDWSVDNDHWSWDDSRSISAPEVEGTSSPSISPPFDLIITSDTIFSPELASHLLRTVHSLCKSSVVEGGDAPTVYVALENRDPRLVDRTLLQAKETWGFDVSRVSHHKVSSALRKGGINWAEEEWEGIEIWIMSLKE